MADAEAERAADDEAARDNLRKMFRLTMATNFRRPGESMESCRQRVAADPATASVARKLRCTVDELLSGWAQDEVFHTAPGYDHAAAVREVETLAMRSALTNASREADRREATGTHVGALKAPRLGERLGGVVGADAASAAQLQGAMAAVRNRGSSGTGRAPRKADAEPPAQAEAPSRKAGSKPAHQGKAPARPVAKGRAHKD